MLRAAQGFVHRPVGRGDLPAFKPEGFYRIEAGVGKYFSLHQVKLAACTGFPGVYIIVFAGGGDNAFFMKQGGAEFGRQADRPPTRSASCR